MKRWHHRDILHLLLSGPAISPVMSGELERQAKWSNTGEVEALMNNLKGIQCSLKEISVSPPASLSHSQCVQQCRVERDTLSAL